MLICVMNDINMLMTDQGREATTLKRMIFGIATRIDLLEFITRGGAGDIPSSSMSDNGSTASSNGSG